MAIYSYDDKSGCLYAHLIDGYLPRRQELRRTAEQIAGEVGALSKKDRVSLHEKPFTWDGWNEDAFFQYIAYNTRGLYHRSLPHECSKYRWSEAWLLKPRKWLSGYELRESRNDPSRRRLFVTLYDGCRRGRECTDNVIQKSGLEVIAEKSYQDLKAFKDASETLLDDIALPFQAPCIVAGERITRRGYDYLSFGS